MGGGGEGSPSRGKGGAERGGWIEEVKEEGKVQVAVEDREGIGKCR